MALIIEFADEFFTPLTFLTPLISVNNKGELENMVFDTAPNKVIKLSGPHGHKHIPLSDILAGDWNPSIPSLGVLSRTSISSLESADTEVKNLDPLSQALTYKALYLNGMRIEDAERIIRNANSAKKAS